MTNELNYRLIKLLEVAQQREASLITNSILIGLGAGAGIMAVCVVIINHRTSRMLGIRGAQYWYTLAAGLIWAVVIGALLGMIAGVITGALHLPLFAAALAGAVFALTAAKRLMSPVRP